MVANQPILWTWIDPRLNYSTVLTTSAIIQTNDQRWPLSISNTANGEQRSYLPCIGR